MDKLFEKEALKILEKDFKKDFSFLSFLLIFLKKISEMRSKIEQLETRLQDSENEVSRQLLSYLKRIPGRKESRVDVDWANLELYS